MKTFASFLLLATTAAITAPPLAASVKMTPYPTVRDTKKMTPPPTFLGTFESNDDEGIFANMTPPPTYFSTFKVDDENENKTPPPNDGGKTFSDVFIHKIAGAVEAIVSEMIFPCEKEIVDCDDSRNCTDCFDAFTPGFSLASFQSCEVFMADVDQSVSEFCDKHEKTYTSLKLCMADFAFMLITIGQEEHKCSCDVVLFE